MNTESKTNKCPYCWGNGSLFRPGESLVECPVCFGSGILSNLELSDLYKREKESAVEHGQANNTLCKKCGFNHSSNVDCEACGRKRLPVN